MIDEKLEEAEKITSDFKNVVSLDDTSLIWPLKSFFYYGVPNVEWGKSTFIMNAKRILNVLRFKNLEINVPSTGVVFLSEAMNFKHIYDLETLTKIFDDEYNYNILRRLNVTHFELLYYDFFSFSNIGMVRRISSCRRVPVEFFITPSLIMRERGIVSHLLRRIKQMRDEIQHRLPSYVVNKAIPEAVRWYLTWEKILQTFKDSPFLFLINEYSPFPYFGVVWAKKLGIPTVALQHGVIHPNHPGYFHLPENIAKDPDDYINYVIPNLTLLQGWYEYRLLRKMGYPKRSLRVTGQPRYDFLVYADEIFDRNKILDQYQLPKSKKFILWTTQTHGLSQKENIANITAIARAMKNLKDSYHLIIKLHPGENQRAPLYRRFFGDKDFVTIIPGYANTYELIYISEAMITKNSTTGIEAIAMNKPVLLTEFVKSVDLSLYTDYGFGYILRDYMDLIEYLSLIETGILLDDFEKKRKVFMRDRLANFGHATEEVVKILERFL